MGPIGVQGVGIEVYVDNFYRLFLFDPAAVWRVRGFGVEGLGFEDPFEISEISQVCVIRPMWWAGKSYVGGYTGGTLALPKVHLRLLLGAELNKT